MEVLFRVPADRAGVPVDHRAGGARPVAGDAGDQGRARYADPATGARADLPADDQLRPARNLQTRSTRARGVLLHHDQPVPRLPADLPRLPPLARSEEHTSELQSLERISYAGFCVTKQKKQS